MARIGSHAILPLIICLLVVGCGQREEEVYSAKHRAHLSELPDIDCQEFLAIATCNIAHLVTDLGNFGDATYDSGRVTVTVLFGKITWSVPLRCAVDERLKAIVKEANELGFWGKTFSKVTLIGTLEISCDKL